MPVLLHEFRATLNIHVASYRTNQETLSSKSLSNLCEDIRIFNWISATPDWVCEVLSPGTLRTDKIKKLPLYGRHGVPHCWLVDPIAHTLDVFRLESGKWVIAGFYVEDDKVRAEPFQEIEIDLSNLWLAAPFTK